MMMEGDIATFIANLTPVIYKKHIGGLRLN